MVINFNIVLTLLNKKFKKKLLRECSDSAEHKTCIDIILIYILLTDAKRANIFSKSDFSCIPVFYMETANLTSTTQVLGYPLLILTDFCLVVKTLRMTARINGWVGSRYVKIDTHPQTNLDERSLTWSIDLSGCYLLATGPTKIQGLQTSILVVLKFCELRKHDANYLYPKRPSQSCVVQTCTFLNVSQTVACFVYNVQDFFEAINLWLTFFFCGFSLSAY